MKSIDLKSVLAFIFVGVMAMIVCIPVYIVYLAQQPATPEQLTEILQETPCAAEAFQETLNYQSEPLTLGKANKIDWFICLCLFLVVIRQWELYKAKMK